MDLTTQRREYETEGIDVDDLDPDPLVQVDRWLEDAYASGTAEPTAAVFATASTHGQPSARTVLLKGLTGGGFVIYTNYDSRKGREALTNPWAALTITWVELSRQVRIEGLVEQVDPAESDAYFATRPRGAQLGAWASAQSQPIADRAQLEHQLAEVHERYAGLDVPRPPQWGGLRVVPHEVELWQGRLDRLHDRLVYVPVEGEPPLEPGLATRIERWDLIRRSP
ncbi:MAG: pyridoxamine 5'-phosphate oxidase [Acidimicrobiales bacterium]|nr:pyridoxamine 5'-phosphate oxidase [Acidimicrobiales bacterium]